MLEQIFTDKYEKNAWLGSESRSWPGSSFRNNTRLIAELEKFFVENNIKTVVDIGCGDFNWMQHFNFNLIYSYIGVDVVKALIDTNNRCYGCEDKIKFKQFNIVDEYMYDNFDLVLCKDVLVHLSYQDALRAIKNIKNSKSLYFVSTTFYDFVNKDIATVEWRPINLEAEPFCFESPVVLWKNIEDKKEGWTNKSVGVWKL